MRRALYIFSLTISLICVCQNTLCAAPLKFDKEKQELRLGIGDMCFETLIWHNQVHSCYYGSPDGVLFYEDRHYLYTPHFSAEYAYHILPWMSVGGVLDFQNTSWHREYYNNTDVMQYYTNENFFNLCIVANVRFNYLRHPHFWLYSSLAPGLDINGGSEKDGFGHNTACGFAADIRLIGMKVGDGHLWGFAEFGGLLALKSESVIYMLGSELIKVGVSYKF